MENTTSNCNEIFHKDRKEYGILLAKLKSIQTQYQMTQNDLDKFCKVSFN